MKDVTIIGGGVAGLITSIQLSKAGISCTLMEKKKYPFHRVCGEYVSNEVIPYLKSLSVFPEELAPSTIHRFQLSSVAGKAKTLALDLGGFGISRYALDHYLYQKAIATGVRVLLETEVTNIRFEKDAFMIDTSDSTRQSSVVIGSFGKRSKIDATLRRGFIKKRSPYVGIKYHVRTDFPSDLVALHNFEGGYCGINHIENGIVNICYLVQRDVLKKQGTIQALEQNVLCKNPYLKKIFEQSDFLFDKPEVINEISFERKEVVHDHILMTGDAAGMITPLCGNGMAMAIHAAKIVSELIIRYCTDERYSRTQMENDYARKWKSEFANRLWFGRQVQKLFGARITSSLAVNLVLNIPPLAKAIVKGTHGRVF